MSYHILEVPIIKKILTVIISLSLLLALSSCGFRFGPPPSSPSPSAVNSPEASPSAEASALASPSASATAQNSPSPETSPSGTAAANAVDRGAWNGDVYTNNFAGIRFTLPKGWTSATDEQIAAMMGQAADLLTDEQKWITESAKLSVVYGMMAQDPDTMDNVTLVYENLSISPGGTGATAKDYLSSVKTQMTAMETLKYTFSDLYETPVSGTKYLTVRAFEENQKITQYYMVRKIDNYMVDLIITTTGDTKLEDFLTAFK